MKQLHAFFYRRYWCHSSNHRVISPLAFVPVGLTLSAGQACGNGHQNHVQRLFWRKTELTNPSLNANWGLETGFKLGLSKPNQSHMMRYDRKKDKSSYQSKGDNPRSQADKDKESDSLPLWVRNQKLLGKIFMVWVVLVIFMLLNVFRVIHVF